MIADLFTKAGKSTFGASIIVAMPKGRIKFVAKPGTRALDRDKSEFQRTLVLGELKRLMNLGGRPVGTIVMGDGLKGGRAVVAPYPAYENNRRVWKLLGRVTDAVAKGLVLEINEERRERGEVERPVEIHRPLLSKLIPRRLKRQRCVECNAVVEAYADDDLALCADCLRARAAAGLLNE